MNQTIKLSENKAQEVIQEIEDKVGVYETRMVTRLQRWNEAAELYMGRTATQKDNSKNSPNSTELYKAIRAMSNMIMRMLLGQKPPFELECLDIIGFTDPAKIIKSEHYLTNQMELSRFAKACYKAINQLLLYGSVVNHMQFEPLRASFLGRKRYITSMRPISLVNCAFSLDSMDIEESSFVALSDIQNKFVLKKLKAHDPDGKIYNLAAIAAAQEDKEYQSKVNKWVEQRMICAGYTDGKFKNGMERRTYYGQLDCMHDTSGEYCFEVVNRKHIIRSEEYEGIRPVSISTINNIDIEPLGSGLYDIFGGHLRKIDDSEQALVNMVALAGANMFSKQKSLTDEDMEFVIRNFGILNLENPQLNPIGPDPRSVAVVDAYRQNEIQKFRNAAGAPDILQALVNEDQATATAVSLAMNEDVRNLSVMAEVLSPTILKHYLQTALQNAQKYNTSPFVLHMGGAPITIIPSDLLIDVNIRIKTTTDQDFRPAKIKNLLAAIQVMDATPPNGITGKKLDSSYAKLELLKLLDVPNWDKSISDITEEDLLRMNVMAQMNPQGPQGQRPTAQNIEPEATGPGVVNTPVGPTLSGPSDQGNMTEAIQSSSPRG